MLGQQPSLAIAVSWIFWLWQSILTGPAIVFVYDYHPLSKTLAEAHFGPSPTFTGGRHVPETAIWSYIVQIASALKSIHTTGLAARVLELSKVLVTSKMRYHPTS